MRSLAESMPLLQQPAAVADALPRDENALGVHTVKDIAEASALLADQVLGRHFVLWLIIASIGPIFDCFAEVRADRQDTVGGPA
jgi:hypothetical protein